MKMGVSIGAVGWGMCHKMAGAGLNLWWGPWKFFKWRNPSVHIFVALWLCQLLTEMSTKDFFLVGGSCCEVQLAHRADNSAVLVVPNIKVRTETQPLIPFLSFHDSLQKLLKNQGNTRRNIYF
jgi:hypothetical protein